MPNRASLFLAICVPALALAACGEEAPPAFDRDAWAANVECEAGSSGSASSSPARSSVTPRDRMIADLEANHLSVGMSRDAVIALLGPPEETLDDGRSLSWCVGLDLPGGVNTYIVTLDTSGRVVSYRFSQS